MSLVKVAFKSTELSNHTSGKLELEWSDKINKKSNLFECFRELFEKLYNDKVKKFTVTIGGNSYSIDKDTFYTNYKTLREKVENTVNRHYPKTNNVPDAPAEAASSNG